MSSIAFFVFSAGSIAAATHQEDAAQAVVDCTATVPGVEIVVEEDRLVVTVGEEPFAEYRFASVSRPSLYPVYAPGPVQITRLATADEPGRVEVRHSSIWFAHGDVNGHDFWVGGEAPARIVQKAILEHVVEDGVGIVRTRNAWVVKEVEQILTEERTMRFSASEDERVIDFDLTLTPTAGAVTFGDTDRGGFAVSVVPELQLGPETKGHCLNASDDLDLACRGRRSPWIAWWGRIGDNPVGLALFDHPQNRRHPTWWEVRPEGFLSANRFGLHGFEAKPKGTGNLVLEPGESLRLRHRIVLYRNAADREALAKHFEEFAGS